MEESKNLIANRTKEIISKLGYEPDEIWCALGSGVLMEGIIRGTTTSLSFSDILMETPKSISILSHSVTPMA